MYNYTLKQLTMTKQIKTNLLIIFVGILLLTFTVYGCNNKESKTVKTEQPVIDSIDSANEAPGSDSKPQ